MSEFTTSCQTIFVYHKKGIGLISRWSIISSEKIVSTNGKRNKSQEEKTQITYDQWKWNLKTLYDFFLFCPIFPSFSCKFLFFFFIFHFSCFYYFQFQNERKWLMIKDPMTWLWIIFFVRRWKEIRMTLTKQRQNKKNIQE